MSISAVAFTDNGMELGRSLALASAGDFLLSHCGEDQLFSWARANYNTGSALLIIGPVSVAVRTIAPFLKDSSCDPAVVALDELGIFSIPLVPGKENSAGALASALAKFTGGTAVMTNAADYASIFLVEPWAKSVGLRIANPDRVKQISVKPFSGKAVKYKSVFPIVGTVPAELEECQNEDKCDFVITYLCSVPEKVLHLVPPVLTLGIDSGGLTVSTDLENCIKIFMQDCSCHVLSLKRLCSLSRWQSDDILSEFCSNHKLPLSLISKEDLSRQDENPDSLAETEKLCERCAVLGSSGGTMLVRETIIDGIAMSLAISEPNG